MRTARLRDSKFVGKIAGVAIEVLYRWHSARFHLDGGMLRLEGRAAHHIH
jgi:hypothetical protein